MVMLFPEMADQSKRYGTSSSQYGDFYGTLIHEVPTNCHGNCHYECTNTTTQMAKEMVDCTQCARSNLGQYAPQGVCQSTIKRACCMKKKRALNCHICECEHQPPVCYENVYENMYEHGVEWDYGQSREPEYLEDHVKHYHPRLAPKVQVLPPRTSQARAVRSAGGCGVRLQAGLRGSKCRTHRSRPPSPVHRCSVGGSKTLPILPASKRYGYYRYYGAGGQGAKTSGSYSAGHGNKPGSSTYVEGEGNSI